MHTVPSMRALDSSPAPHGPSTLPLSTVVCVWGATALWCSCGLSSPAFLWVLGIGGKFGGRCPQLLTMGSGLALTWVCPRASAGAVFLALLLVSFPLEPDLGLLASLYSVCHPVPGQPARES